MKKTTLVYVLHIKPVHGTGATFMLYKSKAKAKKRAKDFDPSSWKTSVEPLVLN